MGGLDPSKRELRVPEGRHGIELEEVVARPVGSDRKQRARVLIIYQPQPDRRVAIGAAAVTDGCTAAEFLRAVVWDGNEKLGFYVRHADKICARWAQGDMNLFAIPSGFVHDGVVLGELAGDWDDLGVGTAQEFIVVNAEPGRHVYSAGEEGERKLRDAQLAMSIRWDAHKARQRAYTPLPTGLVRTGGLVRTPGRTPGLTYRTPLTGNVDLSHVIDPPPQAFGQAFDAPKSDAAIAADNRQMMQLFAKATEQYLTFDSMASDDAASAEARRNQLDRIESIRRADIFATLSDSRAIDAVTIFAKGHYATAISTQWASTAGTKDWANFMEMLYKLFYSTLCEPA
jgi:hypothetical protein